MDAALAAVIAKAEAASPMSNRGVPVDPDRVLLADADGLAYYCSGNDETAPGTARANMLDKLASAARAAGCGRIRLLATARGSDKGKRFAVARVKPYQGQRTSSRRPNNWQFLRSQMETPGALPANIEVQFTDIAEADDLFAEWAAKTENCVIYTQDKDMRMVPGWHLDWLTHILTYIAPGTWELVQQDKVWGRKWFWMQMLHGDTADNIPGLEWYTDGSVNKSGPDKGKLKQIRCGEKSTAVAGLDNWTSDISACIYLKDLYQTCYGERWLVHMLEQGILLWIRKDPGNHLCVTMPGNPLHPLTTHCDFPAAVEEIGARIAQPIYDAETEDDGSIDGTGSTADEPGREVCTVSTAVLTNGGGAGSLSFNGTSAGDLASVVQCTAGEGGEQPQAVRDQVPASLPPWLRAVLAKA